MKCTRLLIKKLISILASLAMVLSTAMAVAANLCGYVPTGQSFSFARIDGCLGQTYMVLWQNNTGLYDWVLTFTGEYIRLTDVTFEPGSKTTIASVGAISRINGCADCGQPNWPAVYSRILPHQETISDLRAFRDEVLNRDPGTRPLVGGLYRHSFEAAALLLAYPELAERAARIVELSLPRIESLRAGEAVWLTPAEITQIRGFLESMEAVASPGFRDELRSVSRGLLTPSGPFENGITVDGTAPPGDDYEVRIDLYDYNGEAASPPREEME